LHELPIEAQWYPIYSFTLVDVNGDGKMDIVSGGNQSYSRIKFGAYRCGKGDVFINKGGFNFERLPASQSGIRISGDVRSALLIDHQLIFGVNDQKPLVYH
jgi:enediyne biosynthesis protein E4